MFLDKYKNQIDNLCRANNVGALFAFGSVLTPHFGNNSDVDLIVSINETDPLVYGENYFNLKFALEDMFGRKVDLLETKAIRNEIFKQHIDKQKKLIYERGKGN